MSAHPRGVQGQAAVEVVALLPLVAIVALAVLQVLAVGVAAELAGHAAEAGAVALLEDRDARQAARESVPGWSRDRMDVSVQGRRVRVRMRPPVVVGVLADRLATSSEAVAGAR